MAGWLHGQVWDSEFQKASSGTRIETDRRGEVHKMSNSGVASANLSRTAPNSPAFPAQGGDLAERSATVVRGVFGDILKGIMAPQDLGTPSLAPTATTSSPFDDPSSAPESS